MSASIKCISTIYFCSFLSKKKKFYFDLHAFFLTFRVSLVCFSGAYLTEGMTQLCKNNFNVCLFLFYIKLCVFFNIFYVHFTCLLQAPDWFRLFALVSVFLGCLIT